MEVVCAGVERVRADYVIDRADFPYYAIELVAEGEGSLNLQGEFYTLSPGVLFAYGPGIPHVIHNTSSEGMRKYFLDFVGTRAEELLGISGLLSTPATFHAVTVSAMHEVTELFDLFLREADREGPFVQPMCASLMEPLLLKIRQLRLPIGKSVSRSHATYEKVRTFIDQQFLRLHNIRQVAEECDVTTVHLSRLFSRFSDCGAYQYLMRRKMNYAAGLLLNEGMLVKEVAHRLGFPDPFQFSRAFKRVYGVSPGQLHSRME
ncbi:MAG: AraC family transcriptional regulator [Rubinisphaera brasiliensis]|uniref:helix-turn-helix transcriptional regulator n=1 Tax=Rubinisphaera brasiliensis TaxID=119 RepID=UPI00391B18B0